MSDNKQFNEHQLNSFIDHELDAEEREQIFAEAEQTPEIDKEICEHRKLKELVRHAYDSVPAPQKMITASPKPHQMSHRRFYTAASVLFAVSFLVGSLLTHNFWPTNTVNVKVNDPQSFEFAEYTQDINKIILHLESNDPALMEAALNRAEYLVANSSGDNPVLVELVTNDKGLDLLRSDLSPFAQRISDLSNQDVVFIACARKIDNLRKSGTEVNLVPEAEARYTALDRVVNRLQQGWSYEKI